MRRIIKLDSKDMIISQLTKDIQNQISNLTVRDSKVVPFPFWIYNNSNERPTLIKKSILSFASYVVVDKGTNAEKNQMYKGLFETIVERLKIKDEKKIKEEIKEEIKKILIDSSSRGDGSIKQIVEIAYDYFAEKLKEPQAEQTSSQGFGPP